MSHPLQPLLNDATVVLAAPTQAWSAASGAMTDAIHGVYHSDSRVFRGLSVTVGGRAPEAISTAATDATTVVFTALARNIDDRSADPRVRLDVRREVAAGRFAETLTLSSALTGDVSTAVQVTLVADFAPIQTVKSGLAGVGFDFAFVAGSPGALVAGSASAADVAGATEAGAAIDAVVDGDRVRLAAGSSSAEIEAPGASVRIERPENTGGMALVVLEWPVTIPAKGSVSLGWHADLRDEAAVVGGASGAAEWHDARVDSGDTRLARWTARALDDLEALRMTTTVRPDEPFLAAGAPWFFTLFGRDSLWAARLLLPFGTAIAGSTLRVLAGLQGAETVGETAEQPGKIMHELRPGTLTIPGEDVSLPPLYYGTVDATALWITLLHDAWRWGLPDDEVRALLPNLRRALEWMRDHGDSDGDGFLEYADTTGHGLANQGWKDSGDSVQWRDGRLAEGPIALCEVQGYAYEAALGGAELLEHFGDGDGDAAGWREWAAALAERFRASFWVDGPAGRYPAIALDASKRAVDTLTSNIGHLLGTGILNAEESAAVAALLVSPELDSGFGLRTMATDSAGFWPLSYHGGSVWAHDTAIAVRGLAHDGFRAEAAVLSEGLLAAAESFDYRMPELHSGDSAASVVSPAPYPAACRPQAWSAAAAVTVAAAAVDARPTADRAGLTVAPLASAALGHVTLEGLRVGTARFAACATPAEASVTPA
ncbi:glycogen debranching N-terminal domain-containing protein [Herbiconiux sp. UC225_62]|uniref:glycogen debranching N-terminal domain-containing protein n=1 Tax=Herbiconiux sp. UC225_62 TaxID=3350168 RepID=UPI0036D2C836